MLLQLLTQNSKVNPHDSDGTVKDPKNPTSVAILLGAMVPAAMPLMRATDPVTMATLAAPLVTIAIAATLLIKGLAAAEVWKENDAAKRPRIPCKIIGCFAIGLTAALLVLVHTTAGPSTALTQGVIATVLALLAFGLDPLKDKGLGTSLERAHHAAKTKVEALQARLDALQAQAAALDEPTVTTATAEVADGVNRLMQAVMLDPMRHRIARQHMGAIFDGTEQTILKFVALWKITPDPITLPDFLDLAEQLADEFHRAAASYANAGAQDLQVEADVLKHLIKRETA